MQEIFSEIKIFDSRLLRERMGTSQVICADISLAMLRQTGNGALVVVDEEFLSFRAESLDAADGF